MSEKRIGICHLCGERKELTFEHIPPRRLFNDRPTVAHTLYGLTLGTRYNTQPPVKKFRRGMGRHSLCERCNGKTAQMYGEAFADWTLQALRYADKVGDDNVLSLPFTIKPLHVIKQIATMALASADFVDKDYHRLLRRFVLVPFEQHLPPGLVFRAYLNPAREGREGGLLTVKRMSTTCVVADVVNGTMTVVFTEIAFPPMGYLIHFKDEQRTTEDVVDQADISYFGRYRYGQEVTLALRLPVRNPFGPMATNYGRN